MVSAYENGANAFDCLNKLLGLSLPVKSYLDIYRNHKPEIVLSEVAEEILAKLKFNGCKLGLITDGRSVQQRNKIKALGLERFFADKDMVISEELGSEKPCAANYEYFMKKYPKAEYTYVADNPQKDFIGANALGWNTVCLFDDGRNIHKQDFNALGVEYQPKHKINTLSELINLV